MGGESAGPRGSRRREGQAIAGARYRSTGAVIGAASGAGELVDPTDEGSETIFAPISFSSRWNSGEARMIVAAAARSRSTASPGSTKVVGSPFRYSNSAWSWSAPNETSMAKMSTSGPFSSAAIAGSLLLANAADCRSRRWDCQRACLSRNRSIDS